ncbi:hypothetical protein AVO42_02950 [Thiomicrospira sp. XS5]|uniref:HsdM family class I SAM-dependent methyltransferase n=1 Tax=Thiomicrospira sp. XS5 TaxID=1775636 RepID=UPI00074765BE|nr:N-6 DNA methylase [Thiomicrospira sp. XS5]KUJ74384.1 hypothetical protein AVO42_02950 [Thiomicrospira sp. XS5]
MLSKKWLDALNISGRTPPELILPTSDFVDLPHSSSIQKAFTEVGLDAIYCISGVPVVGILTHSKFDHDLVKDAHKALWNQGTMSLLFAISENELRIYSLTQIPNDNLDEKLINILNLISDFHELNNLIFGIESGRFFNENKDKLKSEDRIDNVLLENLKITLNKLTESNLPTESAQALLMQIMFISYLEDKEIISSNYFQEATQNGNITSFLELIRKESCLSEFYLLFDQLKQHFNGDMFVAPSSFESDKATILTDKHINVISDFREGNINLSSGQLKLWPYDFKYIPVDLISAVYDRFLAFDPKTKRESGAFYTPMFLADLVIEQSWSELSRVQKTEGRFVDPSCGSGIFLVRLFEKLIGHWKLSKKSSCSSPSWQELIGMLDRLHGFDIQKESIRVSAFSLYIALLENSQPSELLTLITQKGHVLPKLLGRTLIVADFFDIPTSQKYDLVIGNPPWVSRKNNRSKKSDTSWKGVSTENLPAKEIAWGFTWKALEHLKENGFTSFLLKTTSALTSVTETAKENRSNWLLHADILKIINFSDLRFQLFDGCNAPTSLIIYGNKTNSSNYLFDYWVPKADLNYKTTRFLTISSVDKLKLPINLVRTDPLAFKRHMWMQSPDFKLFQYLSSFPKLGKQLITYKDSQKNENAEYEQWVIGQGFIQHHEKK